MENKETIFDDIKNAAHNEAPTDFKGFEKVWTNVERRLDKEEKKKAIPFWTWPLAASVIMIGGLSIFYFAGPKGTTGGLARNTHKQNPTAIPKPQVKTTAPGKQSGNKNSAPQNVAVTNDGRGYPKPKVAHKQKIQDISSGSSSEGDGVNIDTYGSSSGHIDNVMPAPPKPPAVPIPASSPAINNSYYANAPATNAYAQNSVTHEWGRTKATPNGQTLPSASIGNFKDMLQRQVTGLNVTAAPGAPGTNATFPLHGVSSISSSTSPLIVIDGVPSTDAAYNSLNPNDIENTTVLKDASSTAIYGSRGANGVIVVNTGKGKKNKKIIDNPNTAMPPIVPVPVTSNEESYETYQDNVFESPVSVPLSTFSIDVDNASYTNIRRFINNGQPVPKDAVRIEEMINFFKYHAPQPEGAHPITVYPELGTAPWNPSHQLLRITVQGKTIPEDKIPPSNLVFLIDVSGSMDEPNKLPLLQASLKLLVDKLREKDKISIVTYANGVNVLLDGVTGSGKTTITNAINSLSAGGGTNGSSGINEAYRVAAAHFIKGGNNRIILATDGDFNIGPSSDKEMADMIEEKRKSGIFLTCLGVGMGNYKDSKIQTLADKGNGNYAYLDNIQESNRYLVKEFGGTLFTIAKDVKIQVEFNPANVKAYRLIGYETRKLQAQDFTNDAVDAGEMGSGQAVTALYEIIPPNVDKDPYFKAESSLRYNHTEHFLNDELANIKLRYKKPDGEVSSEIVKQIPAKPAAAQQLSPDFKLASMVAWFGLKLRDSELVPDKSTDDILKWGRSARYEDKEGYIAELMRLIEAAK